ncbi:MAG: fused MFS/spermidine synthase [Gammaproteobacteria bacterium]|nr:fused MFS/spermidine synthase [Gammaproteobacteria bacterium]
MQQPSESVPEKTPDRFFLAYLLLTTMVCGAMVMVIEVLGSRVIGPFFGVSLFVWTSLISVAMVALALGYALGGALSDRHGTANYLYLIIFCAGVLVFVIPWLKTSIIQFSVPYGLRLGSFISASLLFGPSLFLLGCVSPYVVKIATLGMNNLGRTVGGFYAVSTMGSVAGTVLTGFILIAYLRVDQIFILVGSVLMGLSLLYFALFMKKTPLAVAPLLLLLLPSPPSHTSQSLLLENGTQVQLVEARDSHYGSIRVLDFSGDRFQSRELMIDGLIQGGMDLNSGYSTYEFVYYLQLLPYAIHPQGQRALIIGLGAGLMPMWYERQGITSDVVDIDPVVLEMARKHFGFSIRGDIYIEDARYFLSRSTALYDYLILDVFNGDTTPGHLLSVEALKLMRQRLNAQGVLGINLAGSLQTESFMTASIIHTLRQVFDQVEVYPVFDKDKSHGNLAVIAYQGEPRRKQLDKISQQPIHPLAQQIVKQNLLRQVEPVSIRSPIILSDAYNPVDFFDSWLREEVRRGLMQQQQGYAQLVY